MNEEKRIKEIRARCEAATEGPWTVGLLLGCVVYAGACDVIDADNGDDAAFVAHSREDIPYLLDHIAELEKQLSESRTEIEQRNLAGDFAYVIGQFTSSQGENGRLKGENRKLKKELAESQRREKAAVADMNEAQGCACLICKWYTRGPVERCEKFKSADWEKALVCGQFEWRGPQDEKGEKE